MTRFRLCLLVSGCLLLAIPFFGIQRGSASPYTFSSPQAVELNSASNSYPSALQASDGTIWIAWQYYLDQGVYETYKAGIWSGIQPLPTGSAFIIAPEFGQLRNSSIILFWSSNQTGRWNLYYRMNSFGTWTSVVGLTSGAFDDYFPTLAVSANSTVYLFWQRAYTTTSIMIYYKILKNNVWSPDTPLTSGTHMDVTPSAIGTYDGKVWVAWSRIISSTENDVYYRTYNGTAWSLEVPLTTKNYDIQPGLVQDRNGTIWVFWSREMSLGNFAYQQKLWYKNTYDGKSWSPDTQLTFYGNSTTPLDDYEPSVIQGFDKSLWIFYSSSYPLGTSYNIFYINSNLISPVHNVVIGQVQSGPYAFQNSVATITVTVSNLGDYSETIQVTVVTANLTSYTVASAVSENLPAGSSLTFVFAWNTTSVPLAEFTITASYPRLTGQSLLASGGNTQQFRFFTIISPGKPQPGCGFTPRNCPI